MGAFSSTKYNELITSGVFGWVVVARLYSYCFKIFTTILSSNKTYEALQVIVKRDMTSESRREHDSPTIRNLSMNMHKPGLSAFLR